MDKKEESSASHEEDEQGSEEDQESEYKKIHCRMYESKFPQEDDLVYVIKKIK